MAIGLLVITPQVDFILEIVIDGHNRFLISLEDAKELATKFIFPLINL